MTDPTIPTTEAGRALLETIAIAERLSPNGVRVRNYIPPILAIEAEAAASALSALRADYEVVLRRLHLWDHSDCGPIESCRDPEYRRLWGRFAKAEPEGESRG